MLLGLSIRDVVLIDKLDLSFRAGLCVLTGETGAGKSILLDALGLALGVRAESGLVRHGAEQAVVSAEFALPRNHPTRDLLSQAGLSLPGDSLVLRRVVDSGGRSRAFIDDQPVSIGLLRQAGEALVEIEAQFAQRGLLDPATHRQALDDYGVDASDLKGLAEAWNAWREKLKAHAESAERLARARAEEEFLRHALKELEALEPKPGEENTLAEERALLMNRERLTEALEGALGELSGERGGERALNAAARSLERLKDKAGGRLDLALGALERASGGGARGHIRDRSRLARSGQCAAQRREDRGTAVRAPGAGPQAQCSGRRPRRLSAPKSRPRWRRWKTAATRWKSSRAKRPRRARFTSPPPTRSRPSAARRRRRSTPR